jgi:hypothetical protein
MSKGQRQQHFNFSPPMAARAEALRLLAKAQRVDAANARGSPELRAKAAALRKHAEAVLTEAQRIGRW